MDLWAEPFFLSLVDQLRSSSAGVQLRFFLYRMGWGVYGYVCNRSLVHVN